MCDNAIIVSYFGELVVSDVSKVNSITSYNIGLTFDNGDSYYYSHNGFDDNGIEKGADNCIIVINPTEEKIKIAKDRVIALSCRQRNSRYRVKA